MGADLEKLEEYKGLLLWRDILDHHVNYVEEKEQSFSSKEHAVILINVLLKEDHYIPGEHGSAREIPKKNE